MKRANDPDRPRPPRQDSSGFWRPPKNDDAEQCLIGSILLDNEALHEVARFLRPEHFWDEWRSELYRAILDHYLAGTPVDAVTLADEMERRGRYKAPQDDERLREIFESVPHAANAKYYAGIVHQHAVKRDLGVVAREILADVDSKEFTAEELLDRAEAAVFRVAEQQSSESTVTAKSAVADALDRVTRRKRGIAGIGSGLSDLDALTDGFQPGQFVVLAARPSMGKTAMGLCWLEHAALDQREPTLFVSLEMQKLELGERLAVQRSRVPNHKLKSVESLTQADWAALLAANDAWGEAPVLIDDAPVLSPLQIMANARRWRAKMGLKLLIVDYLQLISPSEGSNRQEQVASISKDLKRIARELAIPVVCLCQLNRAVESRADSRPKMADLRESGAIENDADLVMLLYRPDYYDANDQPGLAELIVAKNRNGATGTVKLRFEKHCGRFMTLEVTPPLEAF